MRLSIYLSICIWIDIWIEVWVGVSMYVCMHLQAFMYICVLLWVDQVYIIMNVCVYVCVYPHRSLDIPACVFWVCVWPYVFSTGSTSKWRWSDKNAPLELLLRGPGDIKSGNIFTSSLCIYLSVHSCIYAGAASWLAEINPGQWCWCQDRKRSSLFSLVKGILPTVYTPSHFMKCHPLIC